MEKDDTIGDIIDLYLQEKLTAEEAAGRISGLKISGFERTTAHDVVMLAALRTAAARDQY